MANADIQSQINLIVALASSDPMLQKAWEAYQKGDTAGFESYVKQSAFYQNNNATARSRKQAQVEQPGVAAQDLNSFVSKQKDRLVAAGVKWTPEVETAITNGYWSGMTDTQIDDQIGKFNKLSVMGGTTGSAVDNLKSIANQFGVASLLDDNFWQGQSQLLFSGDTTEQDIKNQIQQLAASTYPAYADSINKGLSMASLSSNVIQTVARYLELAPGSVTFDDPRVRKILQFVDPTTGKPAIMPQWMVEKTVKSDPAWAYTNNARDTVDSLSLKVMQDWGVM